MSIKNKFTLIKNEIYNSLINIEITKIGKYKKNFHQNILWMFTSQAGRSLIQVVYYLLLITQLAPLDYGQFITAVSYAALFSPILAFGLGNLFSYHINHNRLVLPSAYGNALIVSITAGMVYTFILCLAGHLLHGDKTFILIMGIIALGDATFMRIVDHSCWMFIATQTLKYTAILQLIIAGQRLLYLIVLMSLNSINIWTWSIGYSVMTITTGLLGIYFVQRQLGPLKVDIKLLQRDLPKGIAFSFAALSQGQYKAIDKIIVERILGFEAVGIYAAAQRVIMVGCLPINAIMSAAYAKFFQYGKNGLRDALSYARSISLLAISTGALFSILIFLCADYIEMFIGEQYQSLSLVLKVMSPVPFLQSIYYLYADAMAGANLIKIRTYIFLISIILLSLWTITLSIKFQIFGAAISMSISELSVAILFICASNIILNKGRSSINKK